MGMYMEEDVTKELEAGTDSSELFASREEKELVVVHNDKKWVFRYRDLTWREKYECVDAAQVWGDDNKFTFSLGEYYGLALQKMLTHSPISPMTTTTLKNLDTNVFSQLVSIVPLPAEPDKIISSKKG